MSIIVTISPRPLPIVIANPVLQSCLYHTNDHFAKPIASMQVFPFSNHGLNALVLPMAPQAMPANYLFHNFHPSATNANFFPDFPQSLMSISKTCDDSTISIFIQDGVLVHAIRDILITCKGAPLLIGTQDEHGWYCIPLVQHRGHWQPQNPSSKACHALCRANSVYDLPTTEQAIKWMHAVCGYPVK